MIELLLLQTNPAPIRIDQVGYLPEARKIAVTVGNPTGSAVMRSADGKVVLTVAVGAATSSPDTGETVRLIDFSKLKAAGTYTLDIPGVGKSDPIYIGKDVYAKALRHSIRAFTGQRASTNVSLAPDFPQYRYEAGHTASAEYDPSSGKSGTRDVSGGWYDAGDYGRYIVNSGITTGTLLWTFELFPTKVSKLKLDLPNSTSSTPDFLTEVKWNIDWMLKMQDTDGGVWHKATTAGFPGFILPKDDKGKMLVIGTGNGPFKNTTATADFAAVTAIAARVYRPYDKLYADRCLAAAKRAWAWVEKNPNVLYQNNPKGISTGGYGDNNAEDERLWASAELFRTTGETSYHEAFKSLAAGQRLRADQPQGWGSVGNLGLYSYALMGSKKTDSTLRQRILEETEDSARAIVQKIDANPYRMPLSSREYYWGSNSVVANYGMMLLVTDKLIPSGAYRTAAGETLHYLLGRNCFSTSYVTWLGARWPKKPHHRPSGADNVDEPWPGMLVGGPNAEGKNPPAKQWLDVEGSYTTNEIAINWNAPLVFLIAGLR